MPDVVSIALAALQADQSRLESISKNVANAATPGYRRSVPSAVIFDSILDASASVGGENAPTKPSALFAPSLKYGVDQTQAGLTMTGRALDLAVDGVGYFVVNDASTGMALTRAGSFSVDADGWLVNARGGRLQGRQGDLQVGVGRSLAIDPRGQVIVDGRTLDTLKLLVAPEGDVLVSNDGLSLVSGTAEYAEADRAKATIRSGFLEASNATGVRESVGMVETMRHYEGLIRLYQGYDEILGKTIQKLGEF
jgi:flagellar basal body rod protein FlgG